MAKITYANKSALYENSDIPDINKVKASDMNEIKSCVNNNDDMLKGNAVAGNMVVNSIKTKNLFNKNCIYDKVRLGSDGNNYTDNSYFSSRGYIKIKPSTTYTVSKSGTAEYACYCLYDSSFNFISRSGFYTNVYHTFTTTSSSYYLRVCDTYSNLSSLQLEEGNEVTAYSDFQCLSPTYEISTIDNGANVCIKYEDGTMICYGKYNVNSAITTSYGSAYYVNVNDLLFAATFTYQPTLTVSVKSATGLLSFSVNSVASNKFSGFLWSAKQESSSLAMEVHYIAIGKWK